MRVFIGLTGVKTSGKTTAFNAVKEVFPDIQEVQIAKKLKDVCSEVFNIDRNFFDDPSKKEVDLEDPVYLDRKNLTQAIEAYGYKADYDKHVRPHVGAILHSPRKVAQYVGTEVLRAVDEKIHCEGAIMQLPSEGTFVVTDMRFPNEYDFFKNLGNAKDAYFFPIYIKNTNAEYKAREDAHPSEQKVFEVAERCNIVENNSSKKEFEDRVISTVQSFLKSTSKGRKT